MNYYFISFLFSSLQGPNFGQSNFHVGIFPLETKPLLLHKSQILLIRFTDPAEQPSSLAWVLCRLQHRLEVAIEIHNIEIKILEIKNKYRKKGKIGNKLT
jgi:hypothetical protein